MKDTEYQVVVAMPKKDLVGAKCECHAGGDESERVVCVHTLPIIYQLTMLLDDGLAEHVLIELCSRWNTELEASIKDVHEFRKDIEILMRHHGEDDLTIMNAMNKLTIKEMLDSIYATGTQKKKKTPLPPEYKKLRPLRKVDLSSVVNKVKRRKSENKHCDKRSSNNSNETIEESDDIITLEVNEGTGTLVPIPCNFCNSGITTTHICQHPGGKRKIANENESICGLASCIMCCGENERNRTRCKYHRDIQQQHQTIQINNQHDDTYSNEQKDDDLDYYDIYTSIKALGFDIDKSHYPGFQLLCMRVKDVIEKKVKVK